MARLDSVMDEAADFEQVPGTGNEPAVRRWSPVRSLVSAATLVAVFAGALPRLASYDAVWTVLVSLERDEIALLSVAASWNLATYWFLLVAALPGLTLRQAALSNQATTAVSNAVPGGGAWGAALTWAMYRSWGFGAPAITAAMLITGLWNVLVKLAMPAIAIGVASLSGSPGHLPPVTGVVAFGAVVVLTGGVAASVREPAVARAVAGAAERSAGALLAVVHRAAPTGWRQRAEEVRRTTRALVARRWLMLTTSAVASHVALYLVLLASLRTVGVSAGELSWVEALVTFALVRAALIVPVTPGGAGLAELGLAGGLVAQGGEEAAVLAAVLVFRFLTWLVPILLGAAAYGAWVRTRRWGR